MRRIAIIGGGISGLGSARLLQHQGHAVTLFEANDYVGGHTHTVDVTIDGVTAPVDTGFLVFNDRTYPRLLALFAQLGIDSTASEMTFSVRTDAARLEWAGTSLATVFIQRRNLLRPRFWAMLRDILRFNRQVPRGPAGGGITLGQYLQAHGYSRAFRDWYLLPMAAAIWSAPNARILEFPLESFVHFCDNHGLLQITDRPQWRTVTGGGRRYVEAIVRQLPDVRAGTPVRSVQRLGDAVMVQAGSGAPERFDDVVLACHSDEALGLLADATAQESRLLGAVRYQPNRVVLHTDAALLPRARGAWSAWNYLAVDDPDGERPVAVSYLINKLQPLPFSTPVIVTLNPPVEPDPATVLGRFAYSHPLLDAPAIAAQTELAALQGARGTWFAGAWLGFGFHEDGLRSAHAVAEAYARAHA